jgi:hypothetical protein
MFIGYWALFRCDYSARDLKLITQPQPKAKAKNVWSYTSIALYAFMVCQGTALSLLYISQSVCDNESK